MSRYSEKLKRNEVPTPADWEEHLREVHRDAPSMSPLAFAHMRTLEQKNSYMLLAEALGDLIGARVLDLACGDGHLAQYLLRAEAHYTGVDMSDGELNVARRTVTDPRAEFVQAMAQNLPFADHSFDHVVCHMALMLMTPLPPVIAEIRRVLKPGGRFAAFVGATPSDDFMLEVLRMSVEMATARFPGWPNSRFGDKRVSSAAGVQELFGSDFEPLVPMSDVHFAVDIQPEGIWDIMKNMYYVSLLDPKDKAELRDRLIEYARKHARLQRRLHFEYTMKLFSLRRLPQ